MYNKYIQYIKHLKMSNKKALIVFAVCLIILVVICSFLAIFSPEDRRFAIGLFTFGFLTCGFIHITGFYHYMKAVKVLENMGEDPIYMLMVTCYDNELIRSGWLALTKTEFIFSDLEKKSSSVKIQINDVKTIEYGSVVKHIKGMIIVKTDDFEIDFALASKDFENIKKIFSTIKYGN